MSATTNGATAVGVIGSGDAAQTWARALRGCEGVVVRTLNPHADDLHDAIASEELDAIAFATPIRGLDHHVKQAILARKHVLSVPPIADSQQLILLEELVRRRERVLLFDACGLADESMDVAERMTRGDNPARRTRFIRALRVCAGDEDIEGSALEILSRILRLAGELPASVSQVGSVFEDDENPPRAMTLNVVFPSGLTATAHVSQLEPELRDEVTIVCNGRTLMLDGLSERTPLRILTAVRQPDAAKLVEQPGSRAERQLDAAEPRTERVSSAFIDAMQSGQALCNARELASAALVWETARASTARGGDMTALPAHHPLVSTSRPSLHVIEGGGQTTETASVPRLRLVQGGRRTETLAPPPRSA